MKNNPALANAAASTTTTNGSSTHKITGSSNGSGGSVGADAASVSADNVMDPMELESDRMNNKSCNGEGGDSGSRGGGGENRSRETRKDFPTADSVLPPASAAMVCIFVHMFSAVPSVTLATT